MNGYSKKINNIIEKVDNQSACNIKNLLETVTQEIEISYDILSHPQQVLGEKNKIVRMQELPKNAIVACQGVEGAYSHIACRKIFENPTIDFYENFYDITAAVADNRADFGILPIENSTAGEVDDIIELLCQSGNYINTMISIKANHCLAAPKGAGIKNIKQVYSHPQALMQCAGYLKTNNLKPIEAKNTALSAKQVAEGGSLSDACICSELSAQIYGLDILERGIQDYAENHTRFICISKDAIVLPNAGLVAIALSFPNQTGALNKFLIRFSLFDLDLTKIQSMPIGGSDFSVRFHLDFKGNINDPKVEDLLGYMYGMYEDFQFLGNYQVL